MKEIVKLEDGTEVVIVKADAQRAFERERTLATIVSVLAAPRLARAAGAEVDDDELAARVDQAVAAHMERRWPGMPIFGDHVVVPA